MAVNPVVIAVVATIIVLAVWWPIRRERGRRAEEAFSATHPRNADGYIIGAEPRTMRGTRPGAVLVLHGFNDSPQAVMPTANALHAAGWTVRVPALPGHGRSFPDFANSRAHDWETAARTELAQLQKEHGAVAVCGMSMGGALALLLAAETPDVRGVVALAPYLHLSKPMNLLFLLGPLIALGPKYLKGGGKRSIHDPAAAAAIIAYRISTPRLLYELVRLTRHAYDALSSVRQPVLVMQSREDNRIPQRSATNAFERIGSSDKTMVWLSGTGHVITVDYGHADLERQVVAWLEKRLG
jgi:carboxylesterase